MMKLYITPKLRQTVLSNLEFRNCYFDKFQSVEVAPNDEYISYMICEETHGLFKGTVMHFSFKEDDFLAVAKNLFDKDGEWQKSRADKE